MWRVWRMSEDKPKMLPPNLRERKRYLVFKVLSSKSLNYSQVSKAVWYSIANFLGELGTSRAGIWLIKNLYNDKEQLGVFKCKHTYVEELRMSLALVRKIEETDVTIKTLGVTGTIESAKKKYLGVKTLTDFGG